LRPDRETIMRVLHIRRQRRLDAYRRGQRPVDPTPTEDERRRSEERWEAMQREVPDEDTRRD
jgi:hypothetical protein